MKPNSKKIELPRALSFSFECKASELETEIQGLSSSEDASNGPCPVSIKLENDSCLATYPDGSKSMQHVLLTDAFPEVKEGNSIDEVANE